MLGRAIQNSAKPTIPRPLQQSTSTLNAQSIPNKKRKLERTLSTTSSNLGALHQAVYFDENDFENDSDLDFNSTTTFMKPPESTVTHLLDHTLSKPNNSHLLTEPQNAPPPSSTPVPWSSSPPEHLQRPETKRRSLPWTPQDDKDSGSIYPWDQTASALKETQKATRKQTRGSKPTPKDHTGVKRKRLPAIFLSEEQKAVLHTVVNDGKSVFFTGSAGTGKSVLMRQIIQKLKDKHQKDIASVAVTASTGLAACNIEGSTIHSFAGIGLGKEPAPQLVKKVKRNVKAVNRWRSCKVLIIDEVSMVDGDLYDKLEHIARAIKNNGRPFGGIQVVVTGDFFQLPPVPEQNRESKFCFNSQTWTTTIQHTILLTHIFRQKDPVFATMLNEMRLGKLSPRSITAFKNLSRPLSFDDDIDATELFPTRREVDAANISRMKMLSGQLFTYNAKDTPGKDLIMAQKALDNLMAPQTLEFKKGAQVMLIKNLDDSLVNGSLGKIQAFMTRDTHAYWKDNEDEFEEIWGGHPNEEKEQKKREIRTAMTINNNNKYKTADEPEDRTPYPLVRFSLPDGTYRTLLCTPEDWRVEGHNEKDFVAIRGQLPLILAWALSIHKAQGQTLERVKVNLGRVFEKGQAYVALSRATSQTGLQVLNFNANKVMVHQKVVGFYEKLQNIEAITGKTDQGPGKKVITAKVYESNFVDLDDDDDEDAEAVLYG